MNTLGALCAILLCGLFPSTAWSTPGNVDVSSGDNPPPWARRSPAEPLATISLGLCGSYSPFGFPRTNEHLENIIDEIQKVHPGTDLGDLGGNLGILGYVQVLIWEGVGFRLGLSHVKADPPEGFGLVRGEVGAETSPVNLSYSLVKEIPLDPVRFVAGIGIDQYRWSMDWEFYEIGEEPLEEHKWEGRGTGAHGFLEVGANIYGLPLLAGVAYHKGVYEMELELPPITQLVRYARRYEEDVSCIHVYGGMTLRVF